MSESVLPGLTLSEQLRHPWAALFALSGSGSQARPTSPFFTDLAGLEERKASVALRLSRAGLAHGAVAPELERLRWSFLLANLGTAAEPSLGEWLSGTAKEPLKVGERKVERAEDSGFEVYLVGKTRSKFWPFS